MQKYSSKDTSINVVNKVYKQCAFKDNSVILDYGGGKYDTNVDYMRERNGSDVLVYDKYNRNGEHNLAVLDRCREEKPDYIVCSNVLNVIMEDEVIRDILKDICGCCREDTAVYIAIYEGDKSGVGKKTKKGWQRNEKAQAYEAVISEYFNCKKTGNIFVCNMRRGTA